MRNTMLRLQKDFKREGGSVSENVMSHDSFSAGKNKTKMLQIPFSTGNASSGLCFRLVLCSKT